MLGNDPLAWEEQRPGWGSKIGGSVRELTEAEQVSVSHFSRILRPTLPAPEIVERILEGRDQADSAQ